MLQNKNGNIPHRCKWIITRRTQSVQQTAQDAKNVPIFTQINVYLSLNPPKYNFHYFHILGFSLVCVCVSVCENISHVLTAPIYIKQNRVTYRGASRVLQEYLWKIIFTKPQIFIFNMFSGLVQYTFLARSDSLPFL